MKIIYTFILFIAFFFVFTQNILAQTNSEFLKGKVVDILFEKELENDRSKQYIQKVSIELLEGLDKGKYVSIMYGEVVPIKQLDKLKKDEVVVLEKVNNNGETIYNIDEKYRLNQIYIICSIFVILAIIFARLKGITSILGLGVSFIIIVFFIIPNILNGSNPVLISIFGSFLIAVFSLYLAHGLNIKTTISLISTLLTLLLTTLLSFVFVYLAKLTGGGSEEAIFITLGYNSNINLQGLLLGGIIIGTLGVLDDITTAQTAAVNEIHKANPTLNFYELYKRGLNIGVEHIASLVNTLVLAYAGASMPLLLLFSVGESTPLWVILNSQFIAEEIVRTLVGSSGLILAVPISTFLASYAFGIRKIKVKSEISHLGHVH